MEDKLREKIRGIISSTHSRTYYQGGGEFTESGVRVDTATDIILNLVDEHKREWVEGLLEQIECPSGNVYYTEAWTHLRDEIKKRGGVEEKE